MLAIVFLVLMVLWLFVGFWLERIPGQPYPVERGGAHLLLWVLFAILGWQVFNSSIH